MMPWTDLNYLVREGPEGWLLFFGTMYDVMGMGMGMGMGMAGGKSKVAN